MRRHLPLQAPDLAFRVPQAAPYYGYLRSPLGSADPSGMLAPEIIACLVGAGVGIATAISSAYGTYCQTGDLCKALCTLLTKGDRYGAAGCLAGFLGFGVGQGGPLSGIVTGCAVSAVGSVQGGWLEALCYRLACGDESAGFGFEDAICNAGLSFLVCVVPALWIVSTYGEEGLLLYAAWAALASFLAEFGCDTAVIDPILESVGNWFE